jgi:rare lipoprotein A
VGRSWGVAVRGEGWRFAAIARLGAVMVGCLALANCSSPFKFAGKESKYSRKVVADGEPVPKGGGTNKIGQPYTINGRTYYPADNPSYRAEGIASWYGPDFHGRLTANGEVYDMHGISAAHPTLPMPSYARVTNLENGRSIVVRVNDRGPYAHNRIIDLSIGTAKALETHARGLARVRVEYIGRASLEGSDDAMLMATLRHGSPAPAPSRVMVASARPFVPDAPEVTGSRVTTARALPPERPLDPGDRSRRTRTAAPATAAPSDRLVARSVATVPVTRSEIGRGTAPAPAQPAAVNGSSPVSAFAPASPPEGGPGFISGRGLY